MTIKLSVRRLRCGNRRCQRRISQNCGQVCIAGKRLIVEVAIADEFIRRFVAAAADLTMGDPLDEATYVGPMARPRLRAELHAQVEASVAQGARLLLGGTPVDGPGAYYPPTVLVDVTADMTVSREESGVASGAMSRSGPSSMRHSRPMRLSRRWREPPM